MTKRKKPESGSKVAAPTRGLAKTDSRYWSKRVFLSGSRAKYYLRVQKDGSRRAICLGTSQKEVAAEKAARFCADMDAHGFDIALENLRPELAKKRRAEEEAIRLEEEMRRREAERACTVGEYLEAVVPILRAHDLRPSSISCYTRALRGIVADIIGAERTTKRFGRAAANPLRAAVDGASLAILTREAINAWMARFKNRAGDNAAAARRASISANSIARQAKSLFSEKVREELPNLRLPDPPPFHRVKFFKRESMKYVSRINPAELMRAATVELADTDPAAFLVCLLALASGLRKGEIDRLRWSDVDLVGGRVIVEDTEAGRVKSEDSRGAVDIDARTVEILRGFRARATSPLVIPATPTEGEASRAWGNRYRCQAVFKRITAWLRSHGVGGNKPLHTLRKEAGALIVTRAGIYAASRFLRHADIAITAAHYADQKERVTIDMGALLPPENVTPLPLAESRGRPGVDEEEKMRTRNRGLRR